MQFQCFCYHNCKSTKHCQAVRATSNGAGGVERTTESITGKTRLDGTKPVLKTNRGDV